MSADCLVHGPGPEGRRSKCCEFTKPRAHTHIHRQQPRPRYYNRYTDSTNSRRPRTRHTSPTDRDKNRAVNSCSEFIQKEGGGGATHTRHTSEPPTRAHPRAPSAARTEATNQTARINPKSEPPRERHNLNRASQTMCVIYNNPPPTVLLIKLHAKCHISGIFSQNFRGHALPIIAHP